MATKLSINFENADGSSGPGNGIVYNSDFLPNVGEFISLDGRHGTVRERRFAFGLGNDENGVLLYVTALND